MPKPIFAIALFLLLSTCSAVRADIQYKEVGIPLFERVSKEGIQLGATYFNLSLDDANTPWLVANGSLYSFNGRSWQLMCEPQNEGFENLTITTQDTNGKTYAALIGDWGTLEPGESHQLDFLSQKPDEELSEDFAVHVLNMKISTAGELFLMSDTGALRQTSTGEVTIWNHLGNIKDFFELNGEQYLSTQNNGIYRIEGNHLKQIEVEAFAKVWPVFIKSLPMDNGILLASDSTGLYYFDGSSITPWKTSIETELSDGVRDIIRLTSGDFVLAIRRHGLFFLNSRGQEKTRITSKSGDEFPGLSQLQADKQGVIWARSFSDIIKIHYPANITRFDKAMGYTPNWTKIHRIGGKIYFSSYPEVHQGVYNSSGYLTHLSLMSFPPEVGTAFNSIESLGDELLLASETGLWIRSETGECIQISDLKNAFPVSYNPSTKIICATNQRKIVLFEKDANEWHHIGEITTTPGANNRMLFDEKGHFWMEGGFSKASRIRMENGKLIIDQFDDSNGLPQSWVNFFKYDEKVYVITPDRVLDFDEETQSFVPNIKLQNVTKNLGKYIQRPLQLKDDSMIIPTEHGISRVYQTDNGRVVDNEEFELFSTTNILITQDTDDRVWITSAGEVFLYQPEFNTVRTDNMQPVITQTYNGSSIDKKLLYSSNWKISKKNLKWDYADNSVEFHFFTADTHLLTPVQHQIKLEGLDNKWSEPISERKVIFTNLNEGKYTLHIRAIDRIGVIRGESSFPFIILPPYYRSIWAYLFYLFSVVLFLYLASLFLLRRHEKEQNRLKILVSEKTSELQEALQFAEKANEAKGMFLANMSHEIRTPMNAVIGLTQVLGQSNLTDSQQQHLRTIKNSGETLLNIINDILDFSKLDAGQITLEYIPTDLSEIVGDTMDLLQDKAETTNLQLNYLIEKEVYHSFDSDPLRLKQVLLNLVGNALKFTEEGEIFIHCSLDKQSKTTEQKFLRISIKDTGIGIPKDKLDKLFKVFSQVDASTTRLFGGTGLGLAICKYIVDKMNGQIWAESVEDAYTEFILKIPYNECQQSNAFNPYYAKPFKNQSVSVALSGLTPRISKLLNHYFKTWEIEIVDIHSLRENLIIIREDSLNESASNVSTICLVGIQNQLNESELDDSITLVNKPIHPDSIYQTLSAVSGLKTDRMTQASKVISTSKFAKNYPLKILIVEDNKINQRVISLLLKNLGYDADVANNGQESLDKVTEGSFDVLLMDLQMPIMDGMTATRKIREEFKNNTSPWIIAQSASALVELENGIVEPGSMNDFISKPIIGNALKTALLKAYDQLQRSQFVKP